MAKWFDEECAEVFRVGGVGSGKTSPVTWADLANAARDETLRLDARRYAQPQRDPSCGERGDAADR